MHPRLNCDESKDYDLCVCIHVRKGERVPVPRPGDGRAAVLNKEILI
jgi:hypothetical protein